MGSASETHCIDLGLRPPSAELAQKLPGPREEAPVLQKGSPAQRRNNRFRMENQLYRSCPWLLSIATPIQWFVFRNPMYRSWATALYHRVRGSAGAGFPTPEHWPQNHKCIHPNTKYVSQPNGTYPNQAAKKVIGSISRSLQNGSCNASPSFYCIQLASLLVGMSTLFAKVN